MKRLVMTVAALTLALPILPAFAAGHKQAAPTASSPVKAVAFTTRGTVTVAGHRIGYDAVAGTLILRNKKDQPTASMFYVAYMKRGVKTPGSRPVRSCHKIT